jgi:ligand-binding sensor domain-containing protein
LTNETILNDRVENLCSDGTNGIMWIDSRGGLGRFSIEKPNQPEPIKGGGASASSHWLRDFEGKLWLANSRNLKIYEKGKWRDIPVPGSAATFKATPRRAGGLWIARDAKLRFVTADGAGREVATVPWAGQSRVISLLEDSHQRLWIGTVDQGLFCYMNGEFKQVMPATSSISSLLEDSQENIWAGTRGGGLVRVRQRQFFMHDLRSGLQNEYPGLVAK